MNYINPPAKSPENVTHKTFFSHVLNHEIGYNIYLPPDYWKNEEKYPVVYHIHGWQGNESSEIGSTEKAYRNRRAITVFMNSVSSKKEYFGALLQIEAVFINELIPYIDEEYRTNATRENRMLSGFSMGGAMAFYYAVKRLELFAAVTPYAGTYHHQYHKDYDGVGKAPELAGELYKKMMDEERYVEENNILRLVRQKADEIREKLHIDIRIGTGDPLFCDNEIMHLYLNALNIPHEYKQIVGAEHDLAKIV